MHRSTASPFYQGEASFLVRFLLVQAIAATVHGALGGDHGILFFLGSYTYIFTIARRGKENVDREKSRAVRFRASTQGVGKKWNLIQNVKKTRRRRDDASQEDTPVGTP